MFQNSSWNHDISDKLTISENCPREPHDLAYYSKVVASDFTPSSTFARLPLEFTETVLSEPPKKTQATLGAIQGCLCHILID